MKSNSYSFSFHLLILILISMMYVGSVDAQNSFMDRQAKIMKKETSKKVKRASVKKRRYYARKFSKKQTENVDNSSYYCGDITSDEDGGLQYYTVSYDNNYKHNNVSKEIHIDIDFPVGNNAFLDNSIRGWLYRILEKEGEISFETWLSDKYEDESDALDKGEHLLEYYNEQIFNKKKKNIIENNKEVDSIEVSLKYETSRYVSFSCEFKSFSSPSPLNGYIRDYSNMTFRKSDGKQFGWNMIDNQKIEILKDSLSSALRTPDSDDFYDRIMSEDTVASNFKTSKYSTEDAGNSQDYIQSLLEDKLLLPKADPYITEDGIEFDYSFKLESGDYYQLEIPYDRIKPLMTAEAIALVFDHVGAMTIDGVNYDLDVSTATVTGLQNKDTRQVIIPENVTLGDRKFTIMSLNDNCFEKNKELETIKLPNGLKLIGVKCFSGCENLTDISIPSTVTSIGSWCFWKCQKLQSISIPPSVTSMGDNCFSNCTGLTYALLSENMTSLGDYSFFGCRSLPTLSIPGNIIIIGDGCFANCSNLSTIKMSNGTTILGSRCFLNCSRLLNAVLPLSVKELGESCFEGCSSITNFDIPYGVKNLAPSLCKNCNSLHRISIPSSVKTIGEQCFYSCTDLMDVKLPSSLESLGSKCFENCTNILSVSIPNSVKSIGTNCFNACRSLSVVICNWLTLDGITFDSGEFSGIALKPVLFVPDDSKKFYKELFPWKNFDSIKELDPKDASRDIEKAKTKAMERLIKAQKNLTRKDSNKVE